MAREAAGARRRVLGRDVEHGATFSFEVAPAMFDLVEALYRAADEAELEQAGVLRL